MRAPTRISLKGIDAEVVVKEYPTIRGRNRSPVKHKFLEGTIVSDPWIPKRKILFVFSENVYISPSPDGTVEDAKGVSHTIRGGHRIILESHCVVCFFDSPGELPHIEVPKDHMIAAMPKLNPNDLAILHKYYRERCETMDTDEKFGI